MVTLLSNGNVLVASGSDGNIPVASAEFYDPVTATFTPTGSISGGRDEPTATLLPHGRVMVAELYGFGFGYLASAELYDPATNTFPASGSMSVARWYNRATLLPNGNAGCRQTLPRVLIDQVQQPHAGANRAAIARRNTGNPSGKITLATEG